ncbi:HAD family hydrolase [Leifsonia sp. NPDC058292]|uniref:HAD family hydrolase n=1 Tax=Leifsonia sp. NPDC058292 TaxID=3346428 RepID=UPI0036DCE7CB
MTSLNPPSLPAAVFWDMDGTLVDTEPYWMASEVELVGSFGGEWTHDDGLTLVGLGLWNSAEVLRSRGVDLTPDEIVQWLTTRVQQKLDEQGVPWRPGARELLAELKERGIPTALVTMSVRRMAEQIVSNIPFDAFDVIVSGDEVGEPKPHPEPYLRAAELLGVEPADSVAIEDSLVGLASAVASGATSIGVPHIVPLPESDEHTLWTTLDGKTADDIVTLATSKAALR